MSPCGINERYIIGLGGKELKFQTQEKNSDVQALEY